MLARGSKAWCPTMIEHLRETAYAAHYPDHPWRERMDIYAGIEMYSECDKHEDCGPIVEDVNIESGELRAFVATFDPPMVLALLDVAAAAEPVADGVGVDELIDGRYGAMLEGLGAALARVREVASDG